MRSLRPAEKSESSAQPWPNTIPARCGMVWVLDMPLAGRIAVGRGCGVVPWMNGRVVLLWCSRFGRVCRCEPVEWWASDRPLGQDHKPAKGAGSGDDAPQ